MFISSKYSAYCKTTALISFNSNSNVRYEKMRANLILIFSIRDEFFRKKLSSGSTIFLYT